MIARHRSLTLVRAARRHSLLRLATWWFVGLILGLAAPEIWRWLVK